MRFGAQGLGITNRKMRLRLETWAKFGLGNEIYSPRPHLSGPSLNVSHDAEYMRLMPGAHDHGLLLNAISLRFMNFNVCTFSFRRT